MNDLSPSKQPNPEAIPADHLADAREEAHRNFGAAAHYCRCAQLHLEIADDPVALYDAVAVEGYLRAALRALEPVRANIRKEGAEAKRRRATCENEREEVA